jgi:hypothetical protein
MEQSGISDTRWRRAHEAARTLHDALALIGIPETELAPLTSRPDMAGRPRVHVPSLPPESTEKLLGALGPSLGPEFIGRPGMPFVAPTSQETS